MEVHREVHREPHKARRSVAHRLRSEGLDDQTVDALEDGMRLLVAIDVRHRLAVEVRHICPVILERLIEREN